MKLAIFGTGYVGLVTGACFSDAGFEVTCVDIDEKKIRDLQNNIIPIFEPELENIISKNKIIFTTDAKSAIENADIIFIAVGTPAAKDGSADLSAVFSVSKCISDYAHNSKIIVIKSTVPIGTTDQVQKILPKHDVVFNPEFLKQGAAVFDCKHPDRIIIGTESRNATDVMKKLYQSFYQDEKKFLVMDIKSAEMTKYVANAMLATKISFINEMSQIADRVGADIYKVRDGIALDVRIGPHFINPGLGYGGSCFPKDIQALQKTAENMGYHARILQAVSDVNQDQKLFLFDKIMRFYNNNIRGKVFAVWGLAFKPNTDDIRDAASITLIKKLWEQGAIIQAYDPQAMHNFKKLFSNDNRYRLCDSPEIAIKNADALCLVTEWDEFKSVNYQLFLEELKDKVVFDGRQYFEKENFLKNHMNCIQV